MKLNVLFTGINLICVALERNTGLFFTCKSVYKKNDGFAYISISVFNYFWWIKFYIFLLIKFYIKKDFCNEINSKIINCIVYLFIHLCKNIFVKCIRKTIENLPFVFIIIDETLEIIAILVWNYTKQCNQISVCDNSD